jgi:hypothetical protein
LDTAGAHQLPHDAAARGQDITGAIDINDPPGER